MRQIHASLKRDRRKATQGKTWETGRNILFSASHTDGLRMGSRGANNIVFRFFQTRLIIFFTEASIVGIMESEAA